MKALNFTDGIFLNESCVDILHTGRPATSHRRNIRGNWLVNSGYGWGARGNCTPWWCLSKSAEGGDHEGKGELFLLEGLQFLNSVAGQRLVLRTESSENGRSEGTLLGTCWRSKKLGSLGTWLPQLSAEHWNVCVFIYTHCIYVYISYIHCMFIYTHYKCVYHISMCVYIHTLYLCIYHIYVCVYTHMYLCIYYILYMYIHCICVYILYIHMCV